jgi:hypothetical protein
VCTSASAISNDRPIAAVRAYRNLYPALRDLNPSQIVLEYANRSTDDLPM